MSDDSKVVYEGEGLAELRGGGVQLSKEAQKKAKVTYYPVIDLVEFRIGSSRVHAIVDEDENRAKDYLNFKEYLTGHYIEVNGKRRYLIDMVNNGEIDEIFEGNPFDKGVKLAKGGVVHSNRFQKWVRGLEKDGYDVAPKVTSQDVTTIINGKPFYSNSYHVRLKLHQPLDDPNDDSRETSHLLDDLYRTFYNRHYLDMISFDISYDGKYALMRFTDFPSKMEVFDGRRKITKEYLAKGGKVKDSNLTAIPITGSLEGVDVKKVFEEAHTGNEFGEYTRDEMEAIGEAEGFISNAYGATSLPKNFPWQTAKIISSYDPYEFVDTSMPILIEKGYDPKKYALSLSPDFGKNPKLLTDVIAENKDRYFDVVFLVEISEDEKKMLEKTYPYRDSFYAKGGKTMNDKVSDKIRLLKDEGYGQEQAVAIALSMRDSGKLERGGLSRRQESILRNSSLQIEDGGSALKILDNAEGISDGDKDEIRVISEHAKRLAMELDDIYNENKR